MQIVISTDNGTWPILSFVLNCFPELSFPWPGHPCEDSQLCSQTGQNEAAVPRVPFISAAWPSLVFICLGAQFEFPLAQAPSPLSLAHTPGTAAAKRNHRSLPRGRKPGVETSEKHLKDSSKQPAPMFLSPQSEAGKIGQVIINPWRRHHTQEFPASKMTSSRTFSSRKSLCTIKLLVTVK